jgi:NADH:ubiquinone oxidoreductase subunit F (NADH-binding)
VSGATALDPGPAIGFGVLGEPRLLAGAVGGTGWVVDYARHQQLHRGVAGLGQLELEQLAASASLRGRGGGAFSVADKLRSLGPGPRAVVINASESEPASKKDRLLMSTVPHLVFDGAMTVARAIGATKVRVVVHDPFLRERLELALSERPDGGAFRVDVLAGGFVAGEAQAVISWLNGGRAVPPGRRTLPALAGVGGRPTFLSNAESFAQIALLAGSGLADFARSGEPDEPGTMLLTVGGAVARPGVLEVPVGIDLSTVLATTMAAPAAAIAVGGFHGSWLPASAAGTARLSRSGLAHYGASVGSGVVLVLDHATCGLGELARVASWLAGESAGQCGPCRFGLPALAADLGAVLAGDAGAEADLNRHLGVLPGRGACAHPDGAVRFIAAGFGVLRDDVERHLRGGGCGRPVLGRLPVGSGSP